jgi:hypothetical protein
MALRLCVELVDEPLPNYKTIEHISLCVFDEHIRLGKRASKMGAFGNNGLYTVAHQSISIGTRVRSYVELSPIPTQFDRRIELIRPKFPDI